MEQKQQKGSSRLENGHHEDEDVEMQPEEVEDGKKQRLREALQHL